MGCCRRSTFCSFITYAASVLATLNAIAICVIIATELEDVQVNTSLVEIFNAFKDKDSSENSTATNALESALAFLNLNSNATENTNPDSPFVSEAACLLGEDKHNASLCIYMYFVIALSLIASLVLSLIQCLTCNLCGGGRYLDLALAVAATLWWSIAGAVVTEGAVDANNKNVPGEEFRNVVVSLIWAEVVMFGAIVATGVVFCTDRCAGRYYEKV